MATRAHNGNNLFLLSHVYLRSVLEKMGITSLDDLLVSALELWFDELPDFQTRARLKRSEVPKDKNAKIWQYVKRALTSEEFEKLTAFYSETYERHLELLKKSGWQSVQSLSEETKTLTCEYYTHSQLPFFLASPTDAYRLYVARNSQILGRGLSSSVPVFQVREYVSDFLACRSYSAPIRLLCNKDLSTRTSFEFAKYIKNKTPWSMIFERQKADFGPDIYANQASGIVYSWVTSYYLKVKISDFYHLWYQAQWI